jgi:hypothetical protein
MVSKKNCKVKGFQEDNSQLLKTSKWVSKRESPLMIPKGFKVKINLKPCPILTSFLIHTQHWFEFDFFDWNPLAPTLVHFFQIQKTFGPGSKTRFGSMYTHIFQLHNSKCGKGNSKLYTHYIHKIWSPKLFQNQIVILFDKKIEEMINVYGKSKFKLNPKNLSNNYFNVMPTIAMTSK